MFPPIKIGERVQFSQSGSGSAYLTDGWSYPEAWGTWSDGSTANVLLPIITESPNTMLIEANALVSPLHPKQPVEVRMNGVLATTVSLTEYIGNRIEITIPELARKGLKERGYLQVEFKFADPVRPKDIGLGSDTRSLALGLVAITVI